MDCNPPGCSVHGDSPGKNTGVGCHALFQRILPTQELNPGLPHCRWIIYHLSHQGSLRIREWVAYLFFRGSSQLRYQTWVSCIAGRFFTIWASRDIIKWSILKSDWLYSCSWRWKSFIQSGKARSWADCGWDYQLLNAKFRLWLNQVGKTTSLFRYDRNQIPYDDTVEVTNRFKVW